MAGISPKIYYLTLGLLAFCVCLGAVIAYRFQREVADELVPPTEKDLLGPLEKAYYSGLMREDEFRRIQESMEKQKAPKDKVSVKTRRPLPKPKPASDPEDWPELPPETEA